MVKQTRHIFDLSDIKAVRFQCRHCEGEVVHAISNYKIPDSCPLCGQSWEKRDNGLGPNHLLMRGIQDVLRSDNLPMTVRFEIDGEEEKSCQNQVPARPTE